MEKEQSTLNYQKKPFVYKKTDIGLELQSDVYLPLSIHSDHHYAIIVHYHGGGLTIGNRDLHSTQFISDLINENWIYISFEYRLCPEVSIKDLWSDCEDHWKWVFTEVPRLLNIKIDESKIGVVGESAGGYLALLSGYKLHPRPTVIADYYGLAAIDSDYYNKPKENIPSEFRVSEETYRKYIEPNPIAGSLAFGPNYSPIPRGTLWVYLIQEGIFVKTNWGLDIKNPEELKKLKEDWKPAYNITKQFPPTIVLHGDKDPIIPFADSEEVVQSLKKQDVDHQFVIGPGEGHGFMVFKGDQKYDKFMTVTTLWFKKYLK